MFYYTISYWDQIDLRERKDSGLVAAADHGAAVNRVIEYYGKENVFSVEIEEWEDILSEEEVMEGFEEKEN
jgi:hypothetical protein